MSAGNTDIRLKTMPSPLPSPLPMTCTLRYAKASTTNVATTPIPSPSSPFVMPYPSRCLNTTPTTSDTPAMPKCAPSLCYLSTEEEEQARGKQKRFVLVPVPAKVSLWKRESTKDQLHSNSTSMHTRPKGDSATSRRTRSTFQVLTSISTLQNVQFVASRHTRGAPFVAFHYTIWRLEAKQQERTASSIGTTNTASVSASPIVHLLGQVQTNGKHWRTQPGQQTNEWSNHSTGG